MHSNKRTTDPAVEPITADELDTHLRGDGVLAANEGDFLESVITAAREYVEEFTRRALITQSYTLVMDSWPSVKNEGLGWWDGVREGSISQDLQGHVELPMGPLQSITSVTTYAADNTSTVFDSSNYFIDSNQTPGQLVLNTGTVWPSFTRTRNGIEIVYVAGYGNNATDVPGALKMAVKQLAAHWYENREYTKTQSDQNQAPAPLHVQSILNRWKVKRL